MGVFSFPCAVAAVAWILLVVPVLLFPAVKGADLSAVSMNWTCLVYGGTMAAALIWYGFSARFWFTGPKVAHFQIPLTERSRLIDQTRAKRHRFHRKVNGLIEFQGET